MRRLSMTAFVAALLAGGVAVVPGCQGPRALHMVEASGDRAASRGEWEKARREYEELLERRPGRADVRVRYAETLLELGRPALAREQLEVSYAVDPRDDAVLELLARAMLESGAIEAMTTELRRVAEERGGVSDWVRLGVFLAEAGDYDAAERALTTAAVLDAGQTVEPQVALAELYDAIGDSERALRRWAMAAYLSPEDPRVEEAIRASGEIPGPTFSVPPAERPTERVLEDLGGEGELGGG